MTSQINRQQAIDEIEDEGFVPKSFKSQRAPKLEDIPMPSLELKPINLASLKNEVLCHPDVSFPYEGTFSLQSLFHLLLHLFLLYKFVTLLVFSLL